MTANDWSLRGYTLAQLGHDEKAIDCYTRGLDLDPTEISVRANIAAALLRCGNFDEAVSRLEQAVVINPDVGPLSTPWHGRT